jgi:geranylgeranyl diphosphate synthase type I
MRAVIERTLEKINTGLKDLLESANKRYSLGLVSDCLFKFSKDFVMRPGKRIRPLLFVLAYKGYAGKKASPEKDLFTSAAAIELLHDYMLIHDDVIDNSSLRRGKPTLHKMFDKKIKIAQGPKIGASLAIVAGDILFALAIEAFLAIREEKSRKEEALKKLVETAAYTGAGEFIDVVCGYRAIRTLSEKDIFLIYTLKTAKYTFECPLLMGAILAGAPSREQRKLSKLGLAAGQAFQIYDDFLDLFASQATIGKPVLSDLNESKKTLLVYKAFTNLKGSRKRKFTQILEGNNKTLGDLKTFRALIVESGAYAACLKKMTALQQCALTTCRELAIRSAFGKELESLIAKLSPARMPFEP